MRMIVQKMFMLQSHQLRKWGTLTAGVMFVLSVFCVGAAALLHRLVTQMKTGMNELAGSDRDLIGSAPIPADVQSTLLESFEENLQINTDLLEALSTVPIGLVGVSLLSLLAGLLALRAGELAKDLEPSE